MSENQSVEPASPISGSEAGPRQGERRLSVAQPLILLAVVIGAVLFAARMVWESRHPAIAAARGLKAGTPSERLTAIRDLTAAGITDNAIAIPRMTPALRDGDAGVRTAAAESLGLLISYSVKSRSSENEARAAAQDLLTLLKDPQAEVRVAAIHVLTAIRMASPSVSRQAPKKAAEASAPLVEPKVQAEAMIAMLGDRDAAVRAAAVQSLWRVAATDPAAGLPPSTTALKDEDAGVRAAAAEAVGQLIGHAVKNRSGIDQARAAAPELLASRKDPEATVRSAVIQALLMVGTTSPGSSRTESNKDTNASDPPINAGALVAAFTESLGDQESAVRVEAVRALGRLKPSVIPAAAIPPLVSALENRDSDIREEVIRVLAKLGHKADVAIPALIAALKDPVDTDRNRSASAAPALLSTLLTGPAYAAADALGQIAPGSASASKAVACLTEVVESGPTGRRPVAATALAQFGAAAAPAVPALIKLLREVEHSDADNDHGSMTAAALGRIAPGTPSADAAVTALTEALKSKSADTRGAATKALERFSPKERQAKP